MSGEYDHLSKTPLARFRGKGTPLDHLDFCEADTHAIGTFAQGSPNRAQIAAFTGDPGYLTLHGNADCTHWAKKLSDSRWRL